MEFFSRHRAARPNLNRRRVLQAAAIAPAVGLSHSASASPLPAPMTEKIESSFVSFPTALAKQQATFRILRDLRDEADVLFWYHFTMFTIVPGSAPRPVVRWEGIEFSHHKRVGVGAYRVHGHNLSFPRDLETGSWTDSTVNPVTGRTVAVPPMALTGDPGYVKTTNGQVSLDNPSAEPRKGYHQFLYESDLVKVEEIRMPPESWPATFVETSANWSSRTLFEDESILALPAGTAGGYIFPFPEWLEMDGREGHMFAVWHGRKIAGIEQLPNSFLTRAQRTHPELLAVDTSMFAEPLPEPITSRFGL